VRNEKEKVKSEKEGGKDEKGKEEALTMRRNI
jgi:hypothetical protein